MNMHEHPLQSHIEPMRVDLAAVRQWMRQHPDARPMSVYVHVPFCVDRCVYCDFPTLRYRAPDRSVYVDRIVQEIDRWASALRGRRLVSVYFGGGTPGILQPDEIARILATLQACMVWDGRVEITLETTPWTITPARLQAWRDLGINRVSVGIQALNDRLLAPMHRVHRVRHIRRAVRLLRATGWNWNADLLLGFPGQTRTQWRTAVREIIRMNAPHVSIYLLELHTRTPLARWVRMGLCRLPGDTFVWHAWRWAYRTFRAAGYRFYEVANLARPGFQSRHNVRYWQLGDYIGFGLGAHSCVGPFRWQNPERWDAYVRDAMGNNGYPVQVRGRRERLRERILLGLRTAWGIPLAWLEQYHRGRTGWRSFLDTAVRARWLAVSPDGRRIRATPKGWFRLMPIYVGLGLDET